MVCESSVVQWGALGNSPFICCPVEDVADVLAGIGFALVGHVGNQVVLRAIRLARWNLAIHVVFQLQVFNRESHQRWILLHEKIVQTEPITRTYVASSMAVDTSTSREDLTFCNGKLNNVAVDVPGETVVRDRPSAPQQFHHQTSQAK